MRLLPSGNRNSERSLNFRGAPSADITALRGCGLLRERPHRRELQRRPA
jgi:hypothetical protein